MIANDGLIKIAYLNLDVTPGVREGSKNLQSRHAGPYPSHYCGCFSWCALLAHGHRCRNAVTARNVNSMTHLSAVNQFSHDEFLFEDDSAVRPRCPGRLVIMRGAHPRMITNCVFSVAPSLGTHGARITEIRGSNPLSSNGPGFPTPTIRQQYSALARKPMNANSDKSLEYLSWLTILGRSVSLRCITILQKSFKLRRIRPNEAG